MTHKNIFLVSYDISSDKKRNRAVKILEQYGYERIQYSVFTGLIAPHRNKNLWQKLQRLVNDENSPGNKLVCFAISKPAFRNMKIIGSFTADIEYLTGEKHTEVL